METLKKTLGISLLLITFLCSGQILGQKRNTNTSNRNVKSERTYNNDRVDINHRRNNRYRTQPILRNPHYRYPNRRRIIRTLPIHHVRTVYRGLPYFYYSGIYYTLYGDQYIVVMPPRGFRISVLPIGHVSVVVGPSQYFYHSGVYYTENSTTVEGEGQYEVTQPPVGIRVDEISNESEEVFIDGKTFYDFNNVLYKKIIDSQGNINYEVVYSKSDNN